jgi:hypothetical protein
MRCSHQPFGPVDHRAEVIAVAFDGRPRYEDRYAREAASSVGPSPAALRRRRPRRRRPSRTRWANPSPAVANTQPPCSSATARSTASCCAAAAAISMDRSSHRRVEPSTSLNGNVGVPVGRPVVTATAIRIAHQQRKRDHGPRCPPRAFGGDCQSRPAGSGSPTPARWSARYRAWISPGTAGYAAAEYVESQAPRVVILQTGAAIGRVIDRPWRRAPPLPGAAWRPVWARAVDGR